MKTSSEKESSDSIKDRVAGFFIRGGTLDKACAATAFPFEIRPQQQKMAEAVAAALINSEHLAVEAGTGIGKTFAYLVPLVLYAVHSENRVAVSTYTINLQEQLMFKDIPFLLGNMDVDFKVALCKGRHNYICLRRLESAHLMSADLFNKHREKELAHIRHWADAGGLAHRLVRRSSLSEGGSRESYEGEGGSLSDFSDTAQPSPDIWRQVCSEHDNCLGKKCRYYLRCFLMKARNAAFDANLLVLNHHLLFSDLALRREGAGILPECETLVIDEAHGLEDIAGEHLGLRLSQAGIQHWLRRLYIPASGKGLLTALREHELSDETVRVWESVEHFFVELGLFANLNGAGNRKYVMAQKPDLKTMLLDHIAHLVHGVKKLKDATKDEELQTELNAICRRGEEIRLSLDFFMKQPEPNHVYWVENGAPRGKLALVSAPIEVAPLLKDILFGSFAPVVMTSATLSVNNSLDFFKKRIGAENCRELILDSPFNYQRQMKVFIAADLPEPNDEKFPDAATKAVAHFVNKTHGRAFVLFTNAELMRHVAGQLKDALAEQGFLLLVQGEGLPRHVMLEAFRQASSPSEMQNVESTVAEAAMADRCRMKNEGSNSKVQNHQKPARRLVRHSSWSEGGSHKPCEGEGGSKIGKSAVLFGLDSFWMGVDVPGEALSNVIIVRLPFAVPDEPLVKARIDRITAEGKDAFREYSLPQAILKFRQGIGRLIRTATDEGIIVILDSRIISRWYGKFFLQAIPECLVEQVRLEEGF